MKRKKEGYGNRTRVLKRKKKLVRYVSCDEVRSEKKIYIYNI